MNRYNVRLKPNYRFNTAQVGGREFLKVLPTLVHESEMTDEIRNSPLLDVELVVETLVNKVTPKAVKIADESRRVVAPVIPPASPLAPDDDEPDAVKKLRAQPRHGKP